MKKTINWQGYQENGLTLSFDNDKTLKVEYNGLLEKSGAEEIYVHYGYGYNNWDNTKTLKMNRTQQGFAGHITVENNEPVQVCFKDNANNWDNNHGWNYRIETKK